MLNLEEADLTNNKIKSFQLRFGVQDNPEMFNVEGERCVFFLRIGETSKRLCPL